MNWIPFLIGKVKCFRGYLKNKKQTKKPIWNKDPVNSGKQEKNIKYRATSDFPVVLQILSA